MILPQVLLLLVVGFWLESHVTAAASSTKSPTFYCGQTPCKAPGKCCGKHNEACCTSTGTAWCSMWRCCFLKGKRKDPSNTVCTCNTAFSQSYILQGEGVFLIVAIVVIGVGVGIAVGVYFFLRRRRAVPYARG